MKVDINRLKAPACFLVMTLVAIVLLGVMGSGDEQDSDEVSNTQQATYEVIQPYNTSIVDDSEF